MCRGLSVVSIGTCRNGGVVEMAVNMTLREQLMVAGDELLCLHFFRFVHILISRELSSGDREESNVVSMCTYPTLKRCVSQSELGIINDTLLPASATVTEMC